MRQVLAANAYDNAASPEAAACSNRTSAILLVEDEVLIRFFLAEELRALGHVVLEAATADEALALLASGIEVDLLLTDVRMPGSLDGAALARRLRQDRPAMRIIVVSGHLRDGELGVEVHGFFSKPIDMPRLARHITALLPGTSATIVPLPTKT